eukprot:2615372-Pyramimonas_sp.AAC.1
MFLLCHLLLASSSSLAERWLKRCADKPRTETNSPVRVRKPQAAGFLRTSAMRNARGTGDAKTSIIRYTCT